MMDRFATSNLGMFLFVTPSDPEEAILIVAALPGDREAFNSICANGIASDYRRAGLKVKRNGMEDGGYLQIYRIAGEIAGRLFLDISMFPTGEGIIMIQFNAGLPLEESVRVEWEAVIDSMEVL